MINRDRNRKDWLNDRRRLLTLPLVARCKSLQSTRNYQSLAWSVADAKKWIIENGCVCAFDRKRFLEDYNKYNVSKPIKSPALVVHSFNAIAATNKKKTKALPAFLTRQNF